MKLADLGSVTSGHPWKSSFFRESTEDGLPFARIRDCKPGVLQPEALSKLDTTHVQSEAQSQAHKGDILIGMDGVKYFYGALVDKPIYVNQRVSWFSPSGSNEFPPEYLHAVINSIVGQSQLLRQMTIAQTVGHITNENVRELLIPVLTEEQRDRIAKMFRKSTTARQQSKSLLERAKRAVEIAIEQDEKTALAYLDGKHFVAAEILPKLFSNGRHYIDKQSIDTRLEAEGLSYKPETIRRYLTEWAQQGLIHDAGRGWYSDLPERFTPDKALLKKLAFHVGAKFPLLEWTMWSTRQLAPFFHHLPARHATFLMVERDAIDTVAETLRDEGFTVAVHPLADSAKNFELTAEETIILRPRLSEHTEEHPPIEQILVDLYAECQKLALFDTSELERVKNNLVNRHRIDISTTKRTAERRKMEGLELP